MFWDDYFVSRKSNTENQFLTFFVRKCYIYIYFSKDHMLHVFYIKLKYQMFSSTIFKYSFKVHHEKKENLSILLSLRDHSLQAIEMKFQLQFFRNMRWRISWRNNYNIAITVTFIAKIQLSHHTNGQSFLNAHARKNVEVNVLVGLHCFRENIFVIL